MVRTYLNTTRSELSGEDEHDPQTGLKVLITRIASVLGNPRGWNATGGAALTLPRAMGGSHAY